MRKLFSCLMCICCGVMFSACGKNTRNEVIFLNHIPNTLLPQVVIRNNVVRSEYKLDRDEDANGFCWRLWSAPRPNYFEKMRKTGWDGNLDGVDPKDWTDNNKK